MSVHPAWVSTFHLDECGTAAYLSFTCVCLPSQIRWNVLQKVGAYKNTMLYRRKALDIPSTDGRPAGCRQRAEPMNDVTHYKTVWPHIWIKSFRLRHAVFRYRRFWGNVLRLRFCIWRMKMSLCIQFVLLGIKVSHLAKKVWKAPLNCWGIKADRPLCARKRGSGCFRCRYAGCYDEKHPKKWPRHQSSSHAGAVYSKEDHTLTKHHRNWSSWFHRAFRGNR